MFSLIVENSKGEQLSLSQNSNYVITGISGLTPPSSTINLSSNYGTDGSTFNSSKVEKRNIVINVKPQKPVELIYIDTLRQNNIAKYIIQMMLEAFILKAMLKQLKAICLKKHKLSRYP